MTRWAPHLLTRKSHFEKQSKKLQSSSSVQFCPRISLILGSKKAMSTSIATTCNQNSSGSSEGAPVSACFRFAGAGVAAGRDHGPASQQDGPGVPGGRWLHFHERLASVILQGFTCKKDLCVTSESLGFGATTGRTTSRFKRPSALETISEIS